MRLDIIKCFNEKVFRASLNLFNVKWKAQETEINKQRKLKNETEDKSYWK